MDSWLARARDAVAAEAGIEPAALELSSADSSILLELARVAAHESGNRTNAPLLCYLVGCAHGGASLEALANAVRRLTS